MEAEKMQTQVPYKGYFRFPLPGDLTNRHWMVIFQVWYRSDFYTGVGWTAWLLIPKFCDLVSEAPSSIISIISNFFSPC